MSLTWEHLAKNAEDPEKIEEAIQRIVEEHNEDSESHLEEGQSLQSHKASEIIDHLAKSIIRDKLETGAIGLGELMADALWYFSSFGHSEGWKVSGSGGYSFDWRFGDTQMKIDGDVNDRIKLRAEDESWPDIVDFGKEWIWQATILMSSYSDADYIFGPANTDWPEDGVGAGFRINNGVASVFTQGNKSGVGWVHNSQNIDAPSDSVSHTFRIYNDPEAGIIYFYINGVVVHSFDSDIPDDDWGRITCWAFRLLDTADRRMYLKDFLLWRKL
jgi:hypothetical protein